MSRNHRKKYGLLILIFCTMMACNTKEKAPKKGGKPGIVNPLLTPSTLPFGAPDFNKITTADLQPALKKAMEEHHVAVTKIIENPAPPTFENTLVALEKSKTLLSRVTNVFYALAGLDSNAELNKIQDEMAPKLASHWDGIYLNNKLFQKIKTLYTHKKKLEKENDLDSESIALIDYYYRTFTIAGANLSDEKKAQLKTINTTLASLQNNFTQTLLKANNAAALSISDGTLLNGLTTSEIKSLKVKKTDTYRIPLQNTTQQPLNQSLKNRAVREKLFKASWNRASGKTFNTKKIILKMAKLRQEKAQLLGFENYASWRLQGTMVKTPEVVHSFFQKIIPSAVKKVKKEAAALQKTIAKDGGNFNLEPWDWGYYAERLRKEKYDLDENEIKPYFELKNVLEKGVFYAAHKLYGITCKQRTDIPKFNPDVLVYELFESNGTSIGLFYGDYFARPSKRGGAWMSNFVTQSKLLNQKPVIFNACNFTKPAPGEPTLLTFNEVGTMFHEFGHALHGFFANQKYPSLSGTSVARDFVEYPSQANEHWALYPEVLEHYAKHYKTGKTIPESLIAKLKRASTFNQGFALTELVEAADLDMNWHTLKAEETITDASDFETRSLKKDGLWIQAVPPRYRSTYFSHIFGGGYAAGYYAYLWTEMLSKDTSKWFDDNGGLTRENGQRYRDMILSKGNTEDYETMYIQFRGKKASILPMLQSRGLK